MNRLFAAAALLLLAACSSTPTQRVVNAPPPAAPVPVQTGGLIGLSTAAVLQRLGPPALRVPEGDSVMLQYKVPSCILDAYVYRRGGEQQVTYVDARDANGQAVDRERCLAEIERSR